MTKGPSHPIPLPLGERGRVRGWLFGHWLLEFIWDLRFGYWDLVYMGSHRLVA